jgi:hypothetical protein
LVQKIAGMADAPSTTYSSVRMLRQVSRSLKRGLPVSNAEKNEMAFHRRLNEQKKLQILQEVLEWKRICRSHLGPFE